MSDTPRLNERVGTEEANLGPRFLLYNVGFVVWTAAQVLLRWQAAWILSLPDQHFNAQLTVALSGLLIGAKNLALARQKANKHPGSHLQFVPF